ncbi:MAG: type VI secretion system accessory protein TagJ [Pyrinomonadaceae bacterium]
METAKTLLAEGNLNGATQAVLDHVKSAPTDISARIFLFELALFSGNWERAAKQLDVIGHQDAGALIGSMIFRQNLAAEKDRSSFFDDGLKPGILAPPPSYIEDLLNANNRIREGSIFEARSILDTIEEERPAFGCKVNGEEVEDFRDYNDPTMCVFEVFFKESYSWLPFENVVSIEFFEPKGLRDIFWRQAKVELNTGTAGEMFFPTLYAGSWKSDDDQIKLGRKTDWRDLGEDLFAGEGQKLYWMDGKERSIMDLRTIEFSQDESE